MKQPYVINIDVSLLDDLRHRLAMTRWTNDINNDNWKTGTNTTYLKELCYYWLHNFDWKKNEAFLNSFSHFRTAIDNEGIHFIHEKGKGKTSVPLLLIHGYPDSFMRFLKAIPLLVAPDDGFSFDVVVPSIPGYGFSDIPTSPGMNPKHIASLFAKLMTEELGYSSFIVHGGDWGSTIAEQIAVNNSQILKGIHLTDIPWRHLFSISPDALTASEKKYVQTGQQWSQTEGGYAVIQSTKPQSLAYGLNDSPVGLAAWLIEKFFSWSGCDGKLENTFTKDELLTNLTIYWATQTITSAMRLYYEAAVSIQQEEKSMEIKKVEVPTGVAIFPQDVVPAPREFAERLFNVQQWTEMPRGGHFTAMEQPDLFAGDVRKFAKSLSGVSLR
ncbi:epoxide hydrolase family protein [Chitinophaga sp. ARDCPP14]|uniref:epoxide hydrolase family protein n=1 Tax=Chitinophaga sp. ARDCPP14 TaxID=3391139 RepID=UPI003F52057D